MLPLAGLAFGQTMMALPGLSVEPAAVPDVMPKSAAMDMWVRPRHTHLVPWLLQL